MARHHTLALAISVAALLLAAASAPASEASSSELKARFVVQLLKYVSWPESTPGQAYVIGVLGDEGVGEALAGLVEGRRVNDRRVEVRFLSDAAAVDGLHVLFLSQDDRAELRRIAREHHGSALLTVAERFEFPELGGDVGIEIVRGRVSFSINRRKSVRGPLKISAKLLRVASEVR